MQDYVYYGDETHYKNIYLYCLLGIKNGNENILKNEILNLMREYSFPENYELHASILFDYNGRLRNGIGLSEAKFYEFVEMTCQNIIKYNSLVFAGYTDKDKSPQSIPLSQDLNSDFSKMKDIPLQDKQLKLFAEQAAYAHIAEDGKYPPNVIARVDHDDTKIDWIGGKKKVSRIYACAKGFIDKDGLPVGEEIAPQVVDERCFFLEIADLLTVRLFFDMILRIWHNSQL